jgi:hypothetical protein
LRRATPVGLLSLQWWKGVPAKGGVLEQLVDAVERVTAAVFSSTCRNGKNANRELSRARGELVDREMEEMFLQACFS